MTPKLILSTILLLFVSVLIGTMTHQEQRTSVTQLDDGQPLVPRGREFRSGWFKLFDLPYNIDPQDTVVAATYFGADDASKRIVEELLTTADIAYSISVAKSSSQNFNDELIAHVNVSAEQANEAGILLAQSPALKGYVEVHAGMPRVQFPTDMNLLSDSRIEPDKLVAGLDSELNFQLENHVRMALTELLSKSEVIDFRYSTRFLPLSGFHKQACDLFIYMNEEGEPRTLWIQLSFRFDDYFDSASGYTRVAEMPGEAMLEHIAYDNEGAAYTRGTQQSMFR